MGANKGLLLLHLIRICQRSYPSLSELLSHIPEFPISVRKEVVTWCQTSVGVTNHAKMMLAEDDPEYQL